MLRELTAPLLPAATALGLVFAIVRREPDGEPAPWRLALIKATVLLGLLTVAAVEGLSAFSALHAAPLAAVWCTFVAVAWGAALFPRAGLRRIPALVGSRRLERLPSHLVAMLAACAVFAALTLMIAVITPPNSWDSMTYHMPRVAHWLANGSVRQYPTTFPHQILMPPFNAYAIATIQALAASDLWANVVQWVAYVAAALAASVIACRIGGGRDAQVLAALALLTVPMAVSQAPTPQADLVTSAWMLLLLVFVVDRLTWENVLWMGATLGLGILSKPLAPFYAMPFCLLIAVRWARERGATRALAAALGVGFVALGLAVPYAARNTSTFGAPWNAGFEGDRNRIDSPGLVSLASNVLRDTVLHLPVPGYGRAVERLHRVLGVDPNDPHTTLLNDFSFSEVAERWFRPLTPNENSVGNPAHLVSALAFLGLALARRRRLSAPARAALLIGAAAAAGWLLIHIPFQWNPWRSRYDLPFFVLLAVPLGVAAARLPRRARTALAAVYVLGALPALLLAVERPLVNIQAIAGWPWWAWSGLAIAAIAVVLRPSAGGDTRLRTRAAAVALALAVLAPVTVRLVARVFARQPAFPPMSIVTADRTDVMFRSNPVLEAPYERVVALVRSSSCQIVGLEFKRDEWEYPLWSLLGAATGGGPRLRAVSVANESAELPPESPEPCVVVSSAAVSAFDAKDGWSREVVSTEPFLSVHRRSVGGS